MRPFGPNGRMRILITGAAGFIGATLAERLLGRGAELVCLPRLVEWFKANHGLG